jgi:AmiR/NasT family two-component response regulator
MSKASEDRSALDRVAADLFADQAASDNDQALADRDQTASESDQRNSDIDQDASDDDFEAGGDAVAHRNSRVARRRSSRSRERTAALRDEGGIQRLRTTEGRDPVPGQQRQLRVLIADEGPDRLETLGRVVSGLGHEVVGRVVDAKDVAGITTREHPDVALVGLGVSSEHALKLIDELVHAASCPVIALLREQDPDYVREAAKRGIFAYIVETGPEELQSAIDITLRRFAEYHDLQGAFGRRAVIEQAKGMLMARHGISDEEAFEILRKHSQHGGGRLSDIAAAVVDTNSLLPPGDPARDPRLAQASSGAAG